MPEARLQRIVTRIAEAALIIVVAVIRSEGSARSIDLLSRGREVGRIFREGTAGGSAWLYRAGVTQCQAQRGISGVIRICEQQVMRLRTHVAQADQAAGADLA